MKILELRFKNLNSLYGEWYIDFSDPAYMTGGIFALTGPTGAGKSTILDAICLALYGSTPRLGKITQSGNEIMSRQSGECYAEVLFESRAGRFRCHWEQRRARKKAEGKLQDQEHHIADADTGKLIETKKSLVAGMIEEKTGMDFDRFTRSVLLAQGGFDTFLNAEVEQKSKILEQITGTEIYSQISMRVHERQRDERNELDLLQAETAGIVTLEAEQEKEIQDDLAARQKQEIVLAGKVTETGKAITWLNTIEGLKKEIRNLAGEAAQLKADTESFKPQRAKLEQAVKAASLDGSYATLTALRKQQFDDQDALKTKQAELPELETSANTQAETLKTAEQFTFNTKEELKAAAPLIKKIRSLDQTLTSQYQSIQEQTDNCEKEQQLIKEHSQKELKLNRYIENRRAVGEQIQKEQQAINALLRDKSLREYRAEKDALTNERLLRVKIEQLESERQKLQDGNACPLCGSYDHPFARGNIPILDEVDESITKIDSLIGHAEHHEEKLAGLQKAKAEVTEASIRVEAVREVIRGLDASLEEKQKDLKCLIEQYDAGINERKKLYGDKKPDEEENRLNQAIAGAEDAAKTTRDLNVGLQQKLTTENAQIETLEKRIEQRVLELNKTEMDFLAALVPAGFADEQVFLKARLRNEERESLSSRAQELDKAGTELKTKQEERQMRLAIENAKQLTDKTFEELEPHLKEVEESLKELRDAIAGTKHKLKENIAAKERIKEKQFAIEAQKKECHRWKKLHDLIGSVDGKKYRNFAQGLTFELMVCHANKQLGKMTDRYLLIRDEHQPLELNVVDNYQAGEIRSSRNLSGGESFIVSLTLALGLSKMASRKVRVDSLFLDEGFGTLDEDALETALETLSGLQQDGKLIGIISHISALKERINTQINVIPLSGGRSSISGPGCTKL